MTRELARLTTTTTALLTSSASSLADDRRVSPPTHSLTDQSAHGEYTRTTSTCTNTAPQSPLDRPYATHGGISQYNNVTLLASRPDSTSPRKPPDCIRPTAGHHSFLNFPGNKTIKHRIRHDSIGLLEWLTCRWLSRARRVADRRAAAAAASATHLLRRLRIAVLQLQVGELLPVAVAVGVADEERVERLPHVLDPAL